AGLRCTAVLEPGDSINLSEVLRDVFEGDATWRLLSVTSTAQNGAVVEIAIPMTVWRELVTMHLCGDADALGVVVV
ncbi:MAG TPA: hypothetical protein VMB26_01595, partial [Candidatus Binataceae bacterium]|nr:hypothetical protein [Candidatus Binataceae bacterium]